MGIAGTLAVNILANTGKFQKGIGKAQKSLRGFGSSVKGVGRSVVGFGSQILGIAAVGGMTAFSKSVIDSATSLGEISDKLGITTDKLELMRFAAEATGVSQGSLDTALQRMIRRVGQAAQGTGEAAKVLKRLNINAMELNDVDPAEQFRQIGDAITDIPDKGGQLAATMAIFDTEGVGLVNLMADGLERYSAAFKRAGGPTSTQGVKNAREFAFHAQTLKGAFAGLGRDFVLDVTPRALSAITGAQILLEELREADRRTEQSAVDREVRGQRMSVARAAQIMLGDVAIGVAGRRPRPFMASRIRQFELEDERQRLISGRPELQGESVNEELSRRMDSLKTAIERQTRDLIEAQKTTSW